MNVSEQWRRNPLQEWFHRWIPGCSVVFTNLFFSFQKLDLWVRDSSIALTDGVRKVVIRAARQAAKMTGDEDFRKMSSHDLRRRFAQRLLVDEELNPRVVMAVGGWDSFAAIEPYLSEPTQSVIDEAFRAIKR